MKSNPIFLSEVDMYKEFLKHYSNILPKEKKLTDTELSILAAFWEIQGDGMESLRFTPQIKKLIRDKFNFKNYANLENYLKSLKDKGFLTKNNFDILTFSKSIDLKRPLSSLEIAYEYRLQENSGGQ
jgi:hypothetical protein